MAEINLLKQNKTDFVKNFQALSALVYALIVVIIGIFSYYGWLVYDFKKVEKQIVLTQEKITQQKQALSAIPKRDEILTRQAQVKELDALINKHVYWSKIIPALAKITLKEAKYLSFQAGEDGSISLSVRVPNMVELDKFFQAFNISKLNKYFSDLKIGGITKLITKEGEFVSVDVKLFYNKDLLKYDFKLN